MIRPNSGEAFLIEEHKTKYWANSGDACVHRSCAQKKWLPFFYRAATLFHAHLISLISSIHRHKQLFPVDLLRFQRFSLRIVADALCVHTTIHPTTSWLLYRPAQVG